MPSTPSTAESLREADASLAERDHLLWPRLVWTLAAVAFFLAVELAFFFFTQKLLIDSVPDFSHLRWAMHLQAIVVLAGGAAVAIDGWLGYLTLSRALDIQRGLIRDATDFKNVWPLVDELADEIVASRNATDKSK